MSCDQGKSSSPAEALQSHSSSYEKSGRESLLPRSRLLSWTQLHLSNYLLIAHSDSAATRCPLICLAIRSPQDLLRQSRFSGNPRFFCCTMYGLCTSVSLLLLVFLSPRPSVRQFQVSSITNEEVAKRRILRAGYPENAVEHPKRIQEMSTNSRLNDKARWNPSSQVGGFGFCLRGLVALEVVNVQVRLILWSDLFFPRDIVQCSTA